jgi:hypothetical protein
MSDAHGGHGGGEKKTAPQKIWGAVGSTISILVGLLVMGYALMSLAPLVMSAFTQTVALSSNEVADFGRAMLSFSTNISIMMTSLFSVVIKIFIYAFLFVFGFWLFREGLNRLKEGGGHDDHGHGH